MKRNMILLLLLIASSVLFIGCNKVIQKEKKSVETVESSAKEEDNKKEEINATERNEGKVLKKGDFDYTINKAKEWENLGFTHLIYASEDKAVISGSVSLLVYDFHEQKITRALDVGVLGMNRDQGDTMTNFIFNKDGSKILMYNNDPNIADKNDIENIYLYEVEEDVLSKIDYTTLEDQYEFKKHKEISLYDNEYLNKYPDMFMLDYWYIDDNNICLLLVPKECNRNRGISKIAFLRINNETQEEKLYEINF